MGVESRVPRAGLRRRLVGDEGFTLIEVLVAAVVLVTGVLALFGLLIVANHAISTTRLRQTETSIARELLEDSRGLAYTQLTPGMIASAVQPQVPGASLSGTNLTVTRSVNGLANTSFNVSFNVCSLDDPSDGYGTHNLPPNSGGVWCPDVAPNGTADSNPDDYKRLSVTVIPTNRSSPVVQQTILIYQQPVNGPAVTCLSTTASCPGSNVAATTGTSLTFNVTTTAPADRIRWLVNGNDPTADQISSGQVDPYTPSGTSSSFTWVFPTADGSYTISAIAYDTNGNSGTRSTIQVTLNRHQVIAPTSLTAGWNDLMNGVDVQWVPSVDQDVLYYHVYHQYGTNSPVLVASCSVNATSCTDTSSLTQSEAPPAIASRPTCTSGSQSYTTANLYWVVGVDTDPVTGLPRESTGQSPKVDANLCDHPPNSPTNLQAAAGNGQVQLTWNAPSPSDPDSWDSIQAWRIYRWTAGTMQDPGSRYQLLGTTSGTTLGTSFTDTSPDPGGVTQSYCVSAVDTHLNESPCSTAVTG